MVRPVDVPLRSDPRAGDGCRLDCVWNDSEAQLNPTWLYVGVLYGAAIAIARRAGVELPRRIAFLFYALVLVFFFKPMTQAYVNIPVDVLSTIPPWSLVEERSFVNAEMNDVTFQHAPWAHQARSGDGTGVPDGAPCRCTRCEVRAGR